MVDPVGIRDVDKAYVPVVGPAVGAFLPLLLLTLLYAELAYQGSTAGSYQPLRLSSADYAHVVLLLHCLLELLLQALLGRQWLLSLDSSDPQMAKVHHLPVRLSLLGSFSNSWGYQV